MKKYFVTVNGALSDEIIKTGNVKLEKKDSKTDKVLFLSFQIATFHSKVNSITF